MAMSWIYLLISVVCEVTGTTFLKMSVGFTKLFPSILAVAFYIGTPVFFALALKKMDISVAYVVSAALGTAAVAIIGFILFREQMSLMKISAIALIVVGIIMLNLSGITR